MWFRMAGARSSLVRVSKARTRVGKAVSARTVASPVGAAGVVGLERAVEAGRVRGADRLTTQNCAASERRARE